MNKTKENSICHVANYYHNGSSINTQPQLTTIDPHALQLTGNNHKNANTKFYINHRHSFSLTKTCILCNYI